MTRFFTNPFHAVSTELLTSSPALLLIHSIHIHARILRSHIRGHILHSRSIQHRHQRTSCHSSRSRDRSRHIHNHGHIRDRNIRSQARQQPWAQPQPQQWLQPPSCRSNRGGHIRRSRNRVRTLRIHHSSHSRVRQQLQPQLPSCRSIHGRSRVRSHHSHNHGRSHHSSRSQDRRPPLQGGRGRGGPGVSLCGELKLQ